MTVINGIEYKQPSLINYKQNDIKSAIQQNDPIENNLHVIVVISNPCFYATRYKLFHEFIHRLEYEEHIQVYVVEMIYPGQTYIVTQENNPHHLQLFSEVPIWHKENMINLGVQLLPSDWKAMAWIDADIEFENTNWALDTLKILNGTKDIVQLFSHCVDMDKDESTMNMFSSFGFNFSKNKKYTTKGFDYWHPGYAWAITRKAYENIGGLYDKGILGSGDNIMALSFINKANTFLNYDYHFDYKQSILDYQVKAKLLRLGYVPGIIRHYYHGSKKNRKYTERWQILIKHQYSPKLHLKYNNGILVPTMMCSPKFKQDIMTYFKERKEDE
jgi:hypothetical protein